MEFNTTDTPTTVYGAQKRLPDKVDILVAGTACVDYSGLNPNPKEWGKPGKSYHTFMAVANYANKFRPKIVLLENVSGAPLNQFEDHYKKIEYVPKAVRVDTKNFYLAQTRCRGYMIAFDKQWALEIGFDCNEAVKQWQVYLESLMRRASSPYAEFLTDVDDPEFEPVRREINKTMKTSNRASDWPVSQIRHQQTRAKGQLGNSRKQTQWENNGLCKFPDSSLSHVWTIRQVERIKDYIEIRHLSNIADRDYDANYKGRIYDVSQNVDFDFDSKHWGLVMCLTPTGMPYCTLRRGPISGSEILIFQGIEERYLRLGKHNNRELMDLAGNAMSTPVIASAIFSAILAGYQKSKGKDLVSLLRPSLSEESEDAVSTRSSRTVTAPEVDTVIRMWEAAGLSLSQQTLTATLVYSMEDVKTRAGRSRQLCACEGYSGLSQSAIFVCIDCGHIACESCKGNPPHNYQFAGGMDRLDPLKFTYFIREALPGSVQFTFEPTLGEITQLFPFKAGFKFRYDPCDRISACTTGESRVKLENDEYQRRVRLALEGIYHFHVIKRSAIWKIVFDSSYGTTGTAHPQRSYTSHLNTKPSHQRRSNRLHVVSFRSL